MAEADLDVVIRSIAKKQIKTLTDAAKKRQARFMGLAAKAKDKAAKDRYRHLAKNTHALASAAARRLQITAENAADSYARSIKKAAEELAASKPAKDRPAKQKPAPKSTNSKSTSSKSANSRSANSKKA